MGLQSQVLGTIQNVIFSVTYESVNVPAPINRVFFIQVETRFTQPSAFGRFSGLVMFPERRSFASAANLCAVMGGSVAVPLNDADNRLLHDMSIANFSVKL